MPLSGSSHSWVARQARDPFVQRAAADGYRSRAAYKLLDLQSRFRLIARGDVVLDLGAAPGSWSQVAAELCASRGDAAAAAAAAATASAAAVPGGGGARPAAPSAGARRRSVFDLAAMEADAAAAAAAPRLPPATTSDAARQHAAASPLRGGGGSGGLVVAVDLLPIQPLKGVVVLQGDFTKATVQERVFAVVQAHRRGGPSAGAAQPSAPSSAPPSSSSSLADVLLSDMAHSFTGEGHTDHLRQTLLSWTALAAAPTFLRRGGHAAVKVKYGQEYKPLVAAFDRRFRRVVEVKPPASRAESSEAYLVGLGWCGRSRALAAVTPDEEAALRQFGLAWPAPPPVAAGQQLS